MRPAIKNLAFKKKYSKNKTEFNKSAYTSYRNKLKALLRKAQRQYYANEFYKRKSNTKATWTLINQILNKKDSTIEIDFLASHNCVSSSPDDIANTMNDYFTSIGSRLASACPPSTTSFTSFLPPPLPHTIVFFPTTAMEIFNIITNLEVSSSCGMDGIPACVIKFVADCIASPLSVLINHSIRTSTFPDTLKIAKIIPIYKSGARSDPSNYRPIALLSTFSKIYEKVIYSRMIDFIKKHDILYSYQYGFRANHSTELALIKLLDTITANWDAGKYACSVIIDLQKAFDSIDVDILLTKLQWYGFRGLAHKFLYSYLKSRSQFVSLSSTQSSILPTSHGVPQGSILGPLLFLLYINDISKPLQEAEPVLFADDATATYSATSPSALVETVNSSLTNLNVWLTANKLTLNLNKSHVICYYPQKSNWHLSLKFCINYNELKQVKQTTILGVTFDHHVSFLPHINTLRKKLASALYIYTNIRDIIPSHVARNLYFTMFHSHLTYCLLIWGNSCPTYLKPINTLQHKFLKAYLQLPKRTPTSVIYKQASILPITELFQLASCKLVYKSLFASHTLPPSLTYLFQPTSVIHSYSTRSASSGLFVLPSNTLIRHNAVACFSPFLWNSIPTQIKSSASLNTFERQLRKFLLSKII